MSPDSGASIIPVAGCCQIPEPSRFRRSTRLNSGNWISNVLAKTKSLISENDLRFLKS
jgi:hypothetical protein